MRAIELTWCMDGYVTLPLQRVRNNPLSQQAYIINKQAIGYSPHEDLQEEHVLVM